MKDYQFSMASILMFEATAEKIAQQFSYLADHWDRLAARIERIAANRDQMQRERWLYRRLIVAYLKPEAIGDRDDRKIVEDMIEQSTWRGAATAPADFAAIEDNSRVASGLEPLGTDDNPPAEPEEKDGYQRYRRMFVDPRAHE